MDTAARVLVLLLCTVAVGPRAPGRQRPDRIAEELAELARETLRAGADGLVVAVDVGGAPLFAGGFGVDERDGVLAPVHAAPLLSELLAVAALRRAQSGELDLDASLASLLPELAREDVRVDHLLTQTSGLPEYADAVGDDLAGADPAAVLAWLARQPADAAPGTCAVHTATNDLLLGLVLERSSDRRLRELVEESVLAPAGMEASGWSCAPPPRDGWMRQELAGALEERPAGPLPFGSEELCSTAADLVRFQRALADGVLLDGAALARRAEPARLVDGTRLGQGRGVSLTELEGLERHSAGGSLAYEHVLVSYYPALDATIVLIARGAEVPLLRLEARVARVAFELPAPVRADRPTPAALRARYAGEYFAGCTPHVVLDERERLVLRRPEGMRSELLLQDDGSFVAADDPDVRVSFRVEDGRAVALVLSERGVRIEARRLY